MEDRSVLRWGGLAGIFGGVLAILDAVLGLAFTPPPPLGPCGPACFVDESIALFPAAKVGTTVGYVVYLSALILLFFLFVAAYRGLRVGSLAPALFGSVLGLFGVLMLAAGGLPSVAFAHLADVYQAPGATAQDQATLVLVSQGVQAIFNETDTIGGILLATAFVLLGIAMRANSAFGKLLGAAVILLALVALTGIFVISVAQDNPNDYAFVIVILILPVILGWTLYKLSTKPMGLQATD